MDGLAAAVGAPAPWSYGGETYLLSPLKLNDWGTIRNHLAALRKDPMDVVRDSIAKFTDPKHQEMLLKMALDQSTKHTPRVEWADVASFIEGNDGMAFTMWLMIRKNHPEFKLGDAERMVSTMSEDELKGFGQARDRASGLDELKNSSPPTLNP